MRKQGYTAQCDKGIKCVKNCHLTSEGLGHFLLGEELTRTLNNELKNQQNPYLANQLKKIMLAVQTLGSAEGEGKLRERVIEQLMVKKLQMTPGSLEVAEKATKASNQMNSAEIHEVFLGRVSKMLESLKADRSKYELQLMQQQQSKRGQAQAASHVGAPSSVISTNVGVSRFETMSNQI